jgi:hypothetical protein
MEIGELPWSAMSGWMKPAMQAYWDELAQRSTKALAVTFVDTVVRSVQEDIRHLKGPYRVVLVCTDLFHLYRNIDSRAAASVTARAPGLVLEEYLEILEPVRSEGSEGPEGSVLVFRRSHLDKFLLYLDEYPPRSWMLKRLKTALRAFGRKYFPGKRTTCPVRVSPQLSVEIDFVVVHHFTRASGLRVASFVRQALAQELTHT